MPLSALLFDLDGTLVDSDPGHFQAFQAVSRRHGVELDKEYFARHISGHSNHEICRSLFPHLTSEQQMAVAEEKERLFRANIGALRPIGGLHHFLRWAENAGLSLAVVSNAPEDNILAVLKALDIEGHFAVRVSAEKLSRGKPHPLPYQTALDRLSIPARNAVAFEDAVPGMSSAVAAGIASVGILTTQPANVLRDAGATLVVRDYADDQLLPFLEARSRGA